MWLATYTEKQAAEPVANVAFELLRTFTRQTRYSISRPRRESLADGRRSTPPADTRNGPRE
jgi:hypothetical protein